jgi:hypothetical protein
LNNIKNAILQQTDKGGLRNLSIMLDLDLAIIEQESRAGAFLRELFEMCKEVIQENKRHKRECRILILVDFPPAASARREPVFEACQEIRDKGGKCILFQSYGKLGNFNIHFFRKIFEEAYEA